MRVNGSWCSKRGIDPVMLYLRDACPSRERCSNKIVGSYTKVHATIRTAHRAPSCTNDCLVPVFDRSHRHPSRQICSCGEPA